MTARFASRPALGAALGEDGRAHFLFFAPDLKSVTLELDERSIEMRRDASGLFEALEPARAGSRYGYRIRRDLLVPDPASRGQPDGVHGLSIVVDPRAYEWRHADWPGKPWREAAILELHAGLLEGFAGVRARLPEYAAAGFTAIELMPIAQFPGERNWGYDGVLPYAPQWSYGGPEELKRLIDAAHELGLMVLLDVVYNHFGPDGNYLPLYAGSFFRTDVQTPWGPALNFSGQYLTRYFIDNAIYWLNEYRFDGLRLDAVHAIADHAWLKTLARKVREACGDGREIWLVLENDENSAELLAPGLFDAQWNDDGHHVLHRLLTGETDGYYADYEEAPAEKLCVVLSEGFLYQGQPSPYRQGDRRGEPSGDLPPTSFVLFTQNHDQIGNRAFGERLSVLATEEARRAATALVLLSPQIPLLFMGEEVGETAPFLFFTDHRPELAELVRDGRRKEFARFARFADEMGRSLIPDPNALSTFEASRPYRGARQQESWRNLVAQALHARTTHIVPHLAGCRSAGARTLGDVAVAASWTLGAKFQLTILCNLGPRECAAGGLISGALIFATSDLPASSCAIVPAFTTVACIGERR